MIKQLVFQQSFLFKILEVPQIQFIDRLCEYSSCATETLWVRIVTLVVFALRLPGGSCPTWYVELDFTENMVIFGWFCC